MHQWEGLVMPSVSLQQSISAPVFGAVTVTAMASLARIRSCRRGQRIYGPDDPAIYWYRIASGAARKCALLADGRRRIVDFLFPGDFFGFATRHRHAFGAEAIAEGTLVALYPREGVEMLVDRDPELGRQIRDMAFDAVTRSQARMLILGRVTAREKVGAFLIEMAERSPTANAVVLPMSRYDIADYLAMSVETVSRSLSDLKHRGTITFADIHRVRILDHDALDDGGNARMGNCLVCEQGKLRKN